MCRYLTVSGVARRIHARPQDISQAFYRRELSDEVCPIVGGRRLIPESFIPIVVRVLRRHGKAVSGQKDHTDGPQPGKSPH